jgi:predicted O-methyltransferase YrrM
MRIMTVHNDAPAKLLNYGRRLLQPRDWPELRRRASGQIWHAKKPRPDPIARDECRAHAVGLPLALAQLGLPRSALRSFAADFPDRWAAARARVEASHGRMGGGADIDLLYSLCLATEARAVLETGVAFGWSSLAILSALNARDGARLVSIDLPYLGRNVDRQVGMAVPDDLRGSWSLHRGADREMLPRAIEAIAPIDLAHYDSDKSYAGRRWAYRLIWDALRPGGILLSDDVGDNLAFRDFVEEIDAQAVFAAASHQDKFVGLVRRPLRSR